MASSSNGIRTEELRCSVGSRTICFLEAGQPDGKPCLFVHGSPGCRLQALRFRSGLEQHNLRLIAPDRPGCGCTFPSHEDTAAVSDIEALLDFLGIEAIPVLAVSGGVATALAAASALPDRITSLVLVSGLGLLTTKENIREATAGQRLLMSLARRRPAAVRLALLPAVLAVRFVRTPSGSGPEAERLAALVSEMKATFQQGTPGPALDLIRASHAERVDLSSIRQPVVAWHGSDDRQAPLTAMSALIGQLPRGELHVLAGEDHFLFERHAAEILSGIEKR
ncbi:MAG TPA: alpha/beta hydrolase [Actinomycetota bacterium]|nr:alpha/beta hydrolase [Actinomycetota bacterium]